MKWIHFLFVLSLFSCIQKEEKLSAAEIAQMYPFAQKIEIQQGRRTVKSPNAGELTGSSRINFPKSRLCNGNFVSLSN